MKADLHIHTIYSSYPLYMRDKKIMERLKRSYPQKAFFEGKLWWAEFLLLDGITSPRKILEIAKKRDLKAIAITDHNTLLGSLEAQRISKEYGLLVIPGMEISTLDGEILAYGIKEKIPMHLSAKRTIDLIHEQGGVAVVAHPFAPKHKNPDFARIEVELIKELDFDGIEVFSPIGGEKQYWKRLARSKKLAETGGSDAHMPSLIGSVWTEFPDNCKDVNDFIEALKRRKTAAGGEACRWPILFKAGLEYLWGNTLGRFFIRF